MNRLSSLMASLAIFLQALRKEFVALPQLRAGLTDEVETLLSGLLAIDVAYRFNLENVSWAAFRGYMVIRVRPHACVYRGSLRINGTAARVVATT